MPVHDSVYSSIAYRHTTSTGKMRSKKVVCNVPVISRSYIPESYV